jgi:hexosaminidase
MKIYFPLLIFWSLIMIPQSNAADIPVIPYPQSVEPSDGSFTMTHETRIVLGDGSTDAERFLSDEIRRSVKEYLGIELTVAEGDDAASDGIIYFGLTGVSNVAANRAGNRITPGMEEEGYILDATPDGIFITAKSSTGLYYGGMTLLQLIENGTSPEVIPGMIIIDYPHYRYRGISDDISRGQVSTQENFKNIIRRLARYKQNVYMPYLEDMFRFESHPLIGKNRGALTYDQVRELDAFARKHHIEIIPIFQTLGHMENMLLLPGYLEYAEYPGAASLNISDERIYHLLQEFFDEIVPAFSSNYFHMAADESWDVGRGASRELVDSLGIAGAHARHFKRVYSMLKAMGKEVIMYGDIATGLGQAIPGYPEVLGQLPDDIIMVYWDYWVQQSYADKAGIFRDAGQPFMVSPGVWNWHPIYPDNINALVNIRNMAHTGIETGAVGFINSSWGDYGGETLRELNWYGYAYGAEVAWSPGHDSFENFTSRYLKDFYGTGNTDLKPIYALLSNVGNNITNLELWKPPFMPPGGTNSWDFTPQFIVDFNQLKRDIHLVVKLLDEIVEKNPIQRNKDYIDYLSFTAQKAMFYIKKVESAAFLNRLKSLEAVDDNDIDKAIAMCETLVAELEQLQEEYTGLWRRTNIDANLDNLITQYYRRQISYWLEMKNELQAGNYWIEQHNPAHFIYHPEATPYVSRGTRKPHVYFRKTFTVDDIDQIEKMMVQTAGDTYLKIYVNGKEVGVSYAKRALSLIVYMARTRFWDITEFLVNGENVIAIEARNYLHAGSAGVNWYSELHFKDESGTELHSDDTWKVAENVSVEWNTLRYEGSNWLNAKTVDQRVPLLDRPSFEHDRMSWIIDRVWTATLED